MKKGDTKLEYVFGTKDNVEILKTKGGGHSDLTGFREIERRYPDQVITDRFRIVRRIDSREDSEGNCYDWYEIDRHYRTVDRSGPVLELSEQLRADVDFLAVMGGIDL